jgi:hypothetical protein
MFIAELVYIVMPPDARMRNWSALVEVRSEGLESAKIKTPS